MTIIESNVYFYDFHFIVQGFYPQELEWHEVTATYNIMIINKSDLMRFMTIKTKSVSFIPDHIYIYIQNYTHIVVNNLVDIKD